MEDPDEYIPRQENENDGNTKNMFQQYVEPNDYGLHELFVNENNVPDMGDSQILEAMSVQSKNLVPIQAYEVRQECCHDDDVCTDDESTNEDFTDDDYDPSKDDDEYARYGVDDDFLFDWVTNKQVTQTSLIDIYGEEVTEEGQCMNDESVEDNEDMFAAIDSDEEMIGPEYISSDEENAREKYPEFNPAVDMIKPWFCCGMLFSTPRILRAAIREMAIQNGWEPLFFKNNTKVVRCICVAENCDFELCASRMQHEPTMQIKKYIGVHTCYRTHDNKAVRVPYLVEKFGDMIKLNTSIKTEELKNFMSSEIKANVSLQQAYRTKKAAMELLEKSLKEQYARVHDYAHELKRVDPETTLDIKCDFDNPQKLPIFKRMYICLGALKMGFKEGCRPIVGLDGCHLKSAYGGQLLCAVGLDANNSTYVIAYAMVEQESKDSWDWFLRLLMKDLDISGEGNGYTIISDKQKGLQQACENVMPLAEHRFCVRHLWTNFNKLFRGKKLKDQLWAIAKSTTIPYYNKEMEIMKKLELAAYNWLADPLRSPKHWCRAYFNTWLKCDVLLNNMCESFNAFILASRSKPIISCFEDIRQKLMKRIATRRISMEKVMDTLCPKPRILLEKNKVKSSTECIPKGTGTAQIEVESFGGSRYVVDLTKRMCACRRWDLTGIPCKHAIAAINFMRQKPEDYVDACYLKSTYMAIYSHTVKPVNGMDLWVPTESIPIFPPQYNRQPGRPKTKRIKDASERESNGKLRRNQRSLKCSNCGELGHNVKSCHRYLPAKPKVVNKKRKRNNEGDSSFTAKHTKQPLKTKNELRAKAKERKEIAKNKREGKKTTKKTTLIANQNRGVSGQGKTSSEFQA